MAGYLAADGIRGAVATTAEACYQALAPGERAAARQVLMRLGNRVDPIVLVDPGGGSIDQVACKPDRV